MIPTLRDYQHESRDVTVDGFFDLQSRRPLVVLPTGTGKTVVFAQLLRHPRMQAWLANYPTTRQRMLVIAHREELLEQAASKIHSANPELLVEIERPGRRAGPFTDVVVVGIQTLVNRLDAFWSDEFRVIVIDEAHHCSAKTYRRVLHHFGVLLDDSDAELPTFVPDLEKLFVGFTATTRRGDAVGLDHVFDRVAYSRDLKWMIEHGYLARLRGLHVDTKIDLDDIKTVHGDFNVNQLDEHVNTTARNALIVNAWREHAVDRKTIAFTVTVQHALDLAEAYRSIAGVKAAAVYGAMPIEERREKLRQFAAGELQVLTNCNLLTEGYDEPSVTCIVHARPTKSSLLYIQMTGRGTRLYPGKDDCLVLDCVDISAKHSLMTVADLVGLPPGFDVEGGDALEAKRRLDALRSENPLLNTAGVKTFAALRARVKEIDLWKAPEPAPELKKFAALAWAASPDGESFILRYPVFDEALSTPEKPLTRDEQLEVRVNQLSTWDITLDDEPLSHATTLHDALDFADRWIHENRRHVLSLIKRDARWRRDPATENQLKWLKRKKVPHDPSSISKGEASRLLDIAFGKK